ncbi:MAG: NADH:flavin oxidoreductase, partial [Pseudomonadota bacterium]
MTALVDPLMLPCGRTLPNRLAKAAMTEGLADARNRATGKLERLYGRWGQGGAGLLLTGNVMVDRRYLERPGNVAVDGPQDEAAIAALRSWAMAAKAGGALLVGQVSHAGRQTPSIVTKEPVGPSAVKVKLPGGLYGTPRALSGNEVEEIVRRFARTSKTLVEAGFDGVQIHAAHGYLVQELRNEI